jgi:hypothetical protein
MTGLSAFTQKMEELGLGIRGASVGVGIFSGTEVDLPGHGEGFFTVLETPGMPPIGTSNEGPAIIRRPSFQVTARAKRYPVARNLIESLYAIDWKAAFVNRQISDRFFLYAAPASEPFTLPLDGIGRVRVTVNIDVTYR